jgi:hypothetical protein
MHTFDSGDRASPRFLSKHHMHVRDTGELSKDCFLYGTSYYELCIYTNYVLREAKNPAPHPLGTENPQAVDQPIRLPELVGVILDEVLARVSFGSTK